VETLLEIARELESELASVDAQRAANERSATALEVKAMAAIRMGDDGSARARLMEMQTFIAEMGMLDADAHVLRSLLAEIREFLDAHPPSHGDTHSHQDQSSVPMEPKHPAGVRWARRPSPDERAAELARDERETQRDIRRAFAAAIAGCVLWLTAGLAFMGWAFHTTDHDLGETLLLSGLLVGYTGMVITLARYYLRGEREGWW
jgi:hypothetical protein